MTIVLIPNLCGELVESFALNVSVVCLQALDPDYEVVALFLRKRQDTLFELSKTHLDIVP